MSVTATGRQRGRRSDARARNHPAWWAFLVHRISGLLLALFLPLHFLALAQSLRSDAALDGFLRFADRPLFKLAEWGLVVLLAMHMTGGVRLLMIELGSWSGLKKDWIAVSVGVSLLAGLAFALALVS